MKRSSWQVLVLVLVVVLFASPAWAKDPLGHWAASGGVVMVGDPDEPLGGGTGFELAAWRVINENFDFGVRVGQLSFDSTGLEFDEVPDLRPGDGKIVPVELALRWYPLGSDRNLFPLVGISVLAPVSDSFDAVRLEVPQIGFILDTDWEVDSVGFAAELGGRYDISGGSWFVELAGRYVILGAESTGIVEVTPTITETRVVETNLDSFRVALHIGYYF